MWQFFCATVTSCLHLLLVDQKTSQKMYVYICIYIYVHWDYIISPLWIGQCWLYPHYLCFKIMIWCGFLMVFLVTWFHILVTWWLRDVMFKHPAHQNGLYQKKLSFEGSLTGITNFKGPILIPSGRDHPIIVSNVALNPPQHYPRSTCLDHVPISTWKCPFGTELFLLGILMRSLKADLKRRSKKSRPCLSATLW